MGRFLGHVSAYQYAVTKGYAGTEEEFAELMASYASVGQEAVDAAIAAQEAQNKAEVAQRASEGARDISVSSKEAAQAAQGVAENARDAAVTAKQGSETAQSKAEEAQSKAEDARDIAIESKTEAVNAKNTATTAKTDAIAARDTALEAKDIAVGAKDTALTAKTDAVNAKEASEDARDSAQGSAEAAAQTLVNVNEAGETQIGLIESAGTDQVTAVQNKGDEVLNSIPDNYEDLTADVAKLKATANSHEDKITFLMSLHMDGTEKTYKKLMKEFFDAAGADEMTPSELTNLCEKWYEGVRDDWNGWTEFYQPSVSTVSIGTRGGDNIDMVCEPSTDTVAGRDDFAGLPLFAPTDVNWEIDPDTLDIVITGIDGITSSFERKNPDKLVGVMQMTGYHWRDETEETFVEGYSSKYQEGHDYCAPVPEAIRIDGSVRPFVVHSKYMGKLVNNKMRCFAGVIPTAWRSHNNIQTVSKANGSQYGGGSVLLRSWLILMTRIKYALLTQDGNIQGCLAFDYQYQSAIGETGVKRVLITPDQAANLEVGCGVLIGTVSSTNGIGRDAATVYNITGQAGAIITAIEEVIIDETTYAAVYVDTASEFDTVGDGTRTAGNTVISTFHWPTGTNDSVLGNDGSIKDSTNGKYPAKLQGIEYSVGCYEVFGDAILNCQDATEEIQSVYYEGFVVDRAANQTTSITSNYKNIGVILEKPSGAGWAYIAHEGFGNGVYMPDKITGGSVTTLTRDAFYKTGSVGLREWPAFATLNHGVGAGGLSCVYGHSTLSSTSWTVGGRPSACANRGEWGVSPH